MAIHYTSYDVRRNRDIIHPGDTTSQRDIMGILPINEQEPGRRFWYAYVLGIYHANVVLLGQGPTDHQLHRLDFLWVRFYAHEGRDSTHSLDRLSFPAVEDRESFGFVNPAKIMRCCHIIPDFSRGKRSTLCQSVYAGDHRDWKSYFVNRSATVIPALSPSDVFKLRFADRDMYMRFVWGSGVGHTYSHDSVGASNSLSELPNDSDIIMEDESNLTRGEESQAGEPDRMVVDWDSQAQTDFNLEDEDDDAQMRGDDFTYSLLAVAEDEDEDSDVDLEFEAEEAMAPTADSEDDALFDML
jgi:hypothetical protein